MSFIPSHIQKRLLRFIITKVDIVDAGTLDLDQLDIAWGMRSSFEFRDLRLNVKQLCKLCHLPPSFEPTHGRISSLKVTIPADLFTSGIRTEVDGIEVGLRHFKSSKDQKLQGSADSDILNPKDVAKEFIENEPEEEMHELEEAIHSQPVENLEESGLYGEASEELETGMGDNIALPGFVAGWLTGIANRSEVSIRNVVFSLSFDLPVEEFSIPLSNESLESSLRFYVEELDIEGLTTMATLDADDPSFRRQSKSKRRLLCRKMRADLTTTSAFFASLSRVPSMPSNVESPEASPDQSQKTRSPTSTRSSAASPPPELTRSQSVRPSSSTHEIVQSHDFGSESLNQSGLLDAQLDGSVHYDRTNLNEEDRYADVSDDGHEDNDGFSSHSAFGFHERFEDSEEDVASEPFPMDLETSEMQSSHASSQASTSQLPSIASLARRTDAQVFGDTLQQSTSPFSRSLSFGPPLKNSQMSSSSPEWDSSDEMGEDLSESKLFTHEDAQSMYQSAMSEIHRSRMADDEDDEHLAYGSGVPIPQSTLAEAIDRTDEALSITPKVTSPLQTMEIPRTPRKSDFPSPQPGASADSLMTKPIIHLDRLFVLVPWLGNFHPAESDRQFEVSDENHADQSLYGMPGAFSYHDKVHKSHTTRVAESATEKNLDSVQDEDTTPEIEIDLGFLEGQFDLSTGRLLYLLFQQVVGSATEGLSQPATPTIASPGVETSASKELSLQINLRRLQIKIQQSLSDKLGWGQIPSSEPLLVSDLEGCKIQFNQKEGRESAKITVDRFSIGLPNEKIISFDQTVPSKEASQILPPPHDIIIRYERNNVSGQEIHVFTRQLVISLDMQKLDERLECYGGLSAILDLSNSIASNGTTLPQMQPKSTLSSPTSTRAPNEDLPSVKVNARVAGMTIKVKGREYGVILNSTALKVVARREQISAQVSHIQVTGPVVQDQSTLDVISVDVANARISFLFTPQEPDIAQLLSLITPSRDPYDDEDDILVDTLVRQRKHGSVLRGSIESIEVRVPEIAAIDKLQSLGVELAKLGNVAKYLPEDDRPGIMTLITTEDIRVSANVNRHIGSLEAELSQVCLAHVGLPQLSAFQVGSLTVQRYGEEIVHPLLPLLEGDELPMLMGKFIPDEMEPTAKIKVFNLAVEYSVHTLMECLGNPTHVTKDDMTASMVASVSTIRGAMGIPPVERQISWSEGSTKSNTKPLRLSVLLRDCGCFLNPENQTSQGMFLLGEAHLGANLTPKDTAKGQLELRSASLLAIDNVALLNTKIQPSSRRPTLRSQRPAVTDLASQGYQLLLSLSKVTISLKLDDNYHGKPMLEVIVNSHLILVETCADSTQTLIKMVDGLKPPTVPESTPRYQTEPMQPEELMQAFSGSPFEQDEQELPSTDLNLDKDDLGDLSDDFEMIGSFYNPEESDDEPKASNRASRRWTLPEDEPQSTIPPFSDKSKLKFRHASGDRPLQIIENHIFKLGLERTVYGWNSVSNRYGNIPNVRIKDCPLRLEIRSETFIWNLFDGYDWQKTRNVINQAVEEIQEKAAQRRMNRQRQHFDEGSLEEESEIGDFLFQSIWIAVPPNKDERELRRRINHEMDAASETGTITTAYTQSSSRATGRGRMHRPLKLERSRRQKVSIQIENLKAEILGLPPNAAETQSSMNIHVGDFEIFDHVPSSTWRKFITYQHDAGMRPMDRPMIHLDIQNVKPKSELAATEMVIKANLLPLRLHVDQDTLDFITRFFEFKDTTDPDIAPPADPPFIQRCEVKTVDIRLDYKPKKVDYQGLRSGRTKEFMNFVGLDDTKISLRRIILYGISGFDRLHKDLNDLWVGDVVRNQLPVVLQGLAPVRPLINVGSGLRQLVMVPMEEYRRDGRVIRSIRKGASAFARTTTSEIARLGARVAIGTGNLIEGAGALLSDPNRPALGEEYYSGDEGRRGSRLQVSSQSRSPSASIGRAISHYANQPLTVAAGLRSAARVLERDLASAHDAIIAVGTEIRESDTAAEVMGAVMRSAPAVILRPAIGASRALGTALLGAGNALDPESRRKIEDKYK